MPTPGDGPLARIAEEIEAVQSLLRLVENEQQTLLLATSIDDLTELAAKKTEAVERISDLARFRYASLARGGYRADEAGMQDWMANAPDPALRERWEFLWALAHKTKSLNQMNGQLIAKLMNQNQTLLGVFGIAAQGSGLYGPDGRPRGVGSGYLK